VSETTDGYDAHEPTAAEIAGGAAHARLPGTVLDTRLSTGAKLVYAVLQRHLGKNEECFPAHGVIAAQASCSERSVRTYVAELEHAGFVRHTQGGTARNRYRLYPNGTAAESGKFCRLNPATVAGFKGAQEPNPANSATESGNGCRPNPAKNDMHIKVEPEPVNQNHEPVIQQQHARARMATSSTRAGGDAAGSRILQPETAAASPGVQVILTALGLLGTASEVRALGAILDEFPHVHHASVAAVCADWWLRNHHRPASVSAYRNWCKKEPREEAEHGPQRGAGLAAAGAAPATNQRPDTDRPDSGIRGAPRGTASPPPESANARGWREHQQRFKAANRHILEELVPVVPPADAG
jgi:hypothetical protein